MLKGRLGLETARIPHADRHGLIWFERGELCVIDGCLNFLTGKDSLTPHSIQVPQQAGDATFTLTARSEKKFAFELAGLEITFVRSETGEVNSLILDQGGETNEAIRVE